MVDRGEDGIGGGLAEPAQACVFDDRALFQQKIDILLPPSPFVMRVSISSRRFVPMRQGTHLPHDSSCVKLRKKRAMSTMHVFSSMTIMPPEPIIEPALVSDS